MNTLIPREELIKIGSSLEDYHKIFYTFWELSSVYFSDEVPTACVRFNKYGNPDMLLGKAFWESLNHREKLFVVCHECLHVLLDHGIRNGKDVKGATHDLVNTAQDITINEMIRDLFNFDREDLREWQKYCWIDTCFKDKTHLVLRNQTFLYYLDLLIKHPPKDLPKLLDQHSAPSSGKNTSSPAPSKEVGDLASEIPKPAESGDQEKSGEKGIGDKLEDLEEGEKKAKDEFAKKIAEDLSAEELEEIGEILGHGHGAGKMAGMFEIVLKKKLQKTRLKFTSIIKKLKRSRMKFTSIDEDSFTRDNRRLHDAISHSSVILPGKGEVERPSKDLLLTALFIDVSGSCIEYFAQFEKIYAAFEAEKKIFEIRAFGFDTRVFPVKPGQRINAGGGTNFEIVENECIRLEKEIGKYPDCVIVITDGDGTKVTPKINNRWIWLLTPDPVYRYIPQAAKKFLIKDVIL